MSDTAPRAGPISSTLIEAADDNQSLLTSKGYLEICNASKAVYELEKRERVLKRRLQDAGIDPNETLRKAFDREAEEDGDHFNWGEWESDEEQDEDDFSEPNESDESDGDSGIEYSTESDEGFSEHERPRSGTGGSSQEALFSGYVVESGVERPPARWAVPATAIKRDHGRTLIVDSVEKYNQMTEKGSRTGNWDYEKVDPAAVVVLAVKPRYGPSTALRHSWWVTISVRNTRRQLYDKILHQIPPQIVQRCITAWKAHGSLKNSSLLTRYMPGVEFHESSRIVPGPDRYFPDGMVVHGNNWHSAGPRRPVNGIRR